MNTLDKVYDLTIDIKNIDVKYNSYAKFFDDDRETSVIRIKLLNDKTPMNLENCIVEAYFILADNTYHNEDCKIINSSEGVVELQLCQKCLVKGENIVRLSILKDNEISNTPVITYEVRKGLYSDNPSFNDDPLTPILSQMLLDIKVTKVNQIELQERYEKSLPKIEGKIKEVESLINRVDTAIASGTQDLEVKEARVDKNGKSYAKLGDRLNEVDSQLEHKASKTEVFSMANMGQDVKEAMTGGSVAVVGKDTVLTENIVDKQVTPDKLQYSKLIILDETVNLLNPNNVIYGKYIDTQGVMQTTSSQNVYCTDFIEVLGNGKYTFKKLLNVKGCWYDANKTFIGNLAYPTTGGSTLTAPSNAKYLRWNGDETTPPNSTMIIYGSTYPSTYISYSDYKKTVELDWLRINQYNLENVILSPKIDLSNKTWYSFGDSITWQDGRKYGTGSQQGQIAKGYQALVKEKTKINYVNKGVSGDTLEGMYNQLVASDKSFDIASFFIGTNDFMFNHDLTRFTNNLNTVCTYITNNLSDKEIFFITPLQRWGYMNGETETTMTNTKGINLVEYVDKMIEICGNYGIPVIDLYRNSQINKLNINIFTRDGLHPIDVGYKKFAYLIEKQIINMLN